MILLFPPHSKKSRKSQIYPWLISYTFLHLPHSSQSPLILYTSICIFCVLVNFHNADSVILFEFLICIFLILLNLFRFFVCFYFSLCSCVFTFWWVQLSLWVSCWAENEIRIQIFSFGRSLHKVESQRQVMIFAFWRISTPWCWYAFHKRIIIYKEFCF